jgi:hypothetical protein
MFHIAHNEWVFESGCSHHMAKDATLFMRLNKVEESRIYVVDDFSLDVAGMGDATCQHGKIVDIYHVQNISDNMLSIY